MRLHTLTLAAIAALLSLPLFSQSGFEKNYGLPGGDGQYFLDVVALPDGGSLLAGYREQPGSELYEAWAVRTDAQHNVLWEKTLGDNAIFDAVRSSDGNFYVLGKSVNFTTFEQQHWVAKLDAAGGQVFKKIFPNLNLGWGKTDIAATPDGGFAIVGQNDGDLTRIMRFNTTGGQVWSKSYSSDPGVESGLVAAADGSFRYFTVFNGQLGLSKLDMDGIVKWSKFYPNNLVSPSEPLNYAEAIAATPTAGGFIFSGQNFSTGEHIVTKTDDDGNITWQAKSNIALASFDISSIGELAGGGFAFHSQDVVELFAADGSSNGTASPGIFKGVQSLSDMDIDGSGNLVFAGAAFNSGEGVDGMRLEMAPATLLETSRKTYGDGLASADEFGYSVQQAADGGFLVGGFKDFLGKASDFYLMKTDPKGAVIWEANYGDDGYDDLFSAIYTSDGGILMTGFHAPQTGGFSLMLVKTDASGVPVWTKKYGFAAISPGFKALELADGSFFIFYRGNLGGPQPSRPGIMKINASGDSLFTKRYATGTNFRDVRLDTDGRPIACGSSSNGYGWVLKTELNGDIVFDKKPGLGGTSTGVSYGIEPLATGGYLLSGNLGTGGSISDSIYLTRLDATGGIVWEKFFDPVGATYFRSRINATTDGNFVLSAFAGSSGANPDGAVILLKTDQNGDQIWLNEYANYPSPFLLDSRATADGGLVATGYATANGSLDIYLLKTNSDGSTAASAPTGQLGALSVSPNPSSGPLALRFESGFLGKIEVSIFDGSGKLARVFGEQKTGPIFEKNYNLAALPDGVYFISVTAEGRSISRTWAKK